MWPGEGFFKIGTSTRKLQLLERLQTSFRASAVGEQLDILLVRAGFDVTYAIYLTGRNVYLQKMRSTITEAFWAKVRLVVKDAPRG
jgi:hypothetical protein